MRKSFTRTLTASVAFAALALTAGIASAASDTQGNWYQAADDSVEQGVDSDTARGSHNQFNEAQPGQRTNKWSGIRREGRGKWRNKRRHAGRGRGRIYDQDLTKGQFFDNMMQRFQRIDADSNGFIDMADIEALQERRRADGSMRGSRRGGRGHRMVRRMERLDADADGKVTPEEYMVRAERRFARLDRNQDGRLNQSDRQSAE